MAIDIAIRYKGLICFGETDEWSGSDEIYLVTSATTVAAGQPVVRAEKHPTGGIYEDVDQGASFAGPIAPCWVGPAQDMSFSVTLFEHDEGDPDAARDKIAVAVVGLTGVLVAAGGGALAWAVPLAGELANALLDTGDDNLGTVVLGFSAQQLALLVFQTNSEERGISHDFFSLHQGQGSTYKAYFDVIINT